MLGDLWGTSWKSACDQGKLWSPVAERVGFAMWMLILWAAITMDSSDVREFLSSLAHDDAASPED